MTTVVTRLGTGDEVVFRNLMQLFGKAFEDLDAYGSAPPSRAYVEALLARDDIIMLAAWSGHAVVGGLVAYVLPKFEQARSEIFIYDLAIREDHRRQGIATALIRWLQSLATRLGAWVIFVQADTEDIPALALYDTFGVRRRFVTFDIEPEDVPS